MLEGARKSEKVGLAMGVKNWDDDAKSGKKTHLLVILCVGLS